MNVLYTTLICFLLISCFKDFTALEAKMDYWNIQHKGANFFNQTPTVNWLVAAKQAGIEFARLAPDKWKCEQRDFLIGNADDFVKICFQDYQVLKGVLDHADNNNIKIVLTLLSLPGSRWRQNNHGRDDLRIWQHEKYKKQAISFWKQLAELLKEHRAIVGYNILNEPHPELLFGFEDFNQIDFENWHQSIKDSLADLNSFYQEIVKAIREVDQQTPIILDTGMYATPWAIRYLQPLTDKNILYSFHMYQLYPYTTRKINKGLYTYPGILPLKLVDTPSGDHFQSEVQLVHWDKTALKEFLRPISQWQKQHCIPSSQIFVGEFGCDRTAQGAETYLTHLIEIFNANKWHWAFYSFREDCWDSMDYELGTVPLNWKDWKAIEDGKSLDEFRIDHPLFDVIKIHLKHSYKKISRVVLK